MVKSQACPDLGTLVLCGCNGIMTRLPRSFDKLRNRDSPTVPGENVMHEDWVVGLPYYDSHIVSRKPHNITVTD